jgi:hypothetical protein
LSSERDGSRGASSAPFFKSDSFALSLAFLSLSLLPPQLHSPLVLPSDLKSFYSHSTNFHLQWSIKMRGAWAGLGRATDASEHGVSEVDRARSQRRRQLNSSTPLSRSLSLSLLLPDEVLPLGNLYVNTIGQMKRVSPAVRQQPRHNFPHAASLSPLSLSARAAFPRPPRNDEFLVSLLCNRPSGHLLIILYSDPRPRHRQ